MQARQFKIGQRVEYHVSIDELPQIRGGMYAVGQERASVIQQILYDGIKKSRIGRRVRMASSTHEW